MSTTAPTPPDPSACPPQLPVELWDLERQYLLKRRDPLSPAPGHPRDLAPGDPRDLVGLALSGGGIRSATLSLGVLQALAEKGLLKFVDYLSTVSGGGYAGTWLGAVYQRWEAKDSDSNRDVWQRVEEVLKDRPSHPVDWLRENGRYLAPNGAGDLSVAVAVVIRNLVALHVVLGVSFLAIFLAINGVRRAVSWTVEQVPGAEDWFTELLKRPDFWWSPILVLAAVAFLLVVVPLGIAYWLVPIDETDGKSRPADHGEVAAVWLLFGLGAMAVGAALHWRLPIEVAELGGLVAVVALLSLAWTLYATWHSERARRAAASGGDGASKEEPESSIRSVARNYLTLRLRTALVVTVLVALFGLLDTLGQTLFLQLKQDSPTTWLGGLAGLGSALVSGAFLAQRLAGALGKRSDRPWRVPATLVASLVALLLVAALLTSVSAVAHALTWKFLSRALVEMDCLRYGLALAITWLFAYVLGRTYAFVNGSSLAALYGGRLSSAYLGASNVQRTRPGSQAPSVRLDGDDLSLSEYRPHARGGPLHLINVTINETFGGQSQVEQRDRKGVGMAVGPAGVSVGVRHHAAWKDQGAGKRATGILMPTVVPAPKADPGKETSGTKPTGGKPPDPGPFRVFPPAGTEVEPRWPTLGRWMAISGAAVSTGLGSRTSLALSLLIGLFNFRLGQWWRSTIDPMKRKTASQPPSRLARGVRWLAGKFPVQAHLLDELLARFPGTSSIDWYLSDGGHFENCGAYELIRRRLPTIIVCDNGADQERRFEDLANLVRKARVDFGASIEFLSEAQLVEQLGPEGGRGVIGTLGELGFGAAEGPAPRPRHYAALARITYAAPPATSMLLWLRPGVLGSEPADVLGYQALHEEFPQESTADQFFDEAQWEAYRRLGQQMAETVFSRFPVPGSGPKPSNGWRPFA